MSKHNKNKQSPAQEEHTGQPAPLSGSHKVKNRNHSRQNQKSGHDM